jgi:beta-lactamase superfamily II metal-dependent hydrolase
MINEELAFEIDFHPVGNGEKGGDAITLRYGKLNSLDNFSQKNIIIDGGSLESGKSIVEHIKNVYNANTVDLVINTHPDNDHCSGLREVLNNLTVKELWVHRPWLSASEFKDMFKDGRITTNSLKQRLKDSLNIVAELEEIAKNKNITIKQPFAGQTFDNNIITVLSPTEDYYKELLPQFRSTPEPKNERVLSKAFSVVRDAVNWLNETLHIETLDETGETSPENNTSVVTLFRYAEKQVLFTGDAGIPALKNVIEMTDNCNYSLRNLDVLQVPHHGSKRNVSPSILNKIKGKSAYISTPKEDNPKHPAKKVTNALIRREMKPYQTKGNILCYRHNIPTRSGYSSATQIPFHSQVEE